MSRGVELRIALGMRGGVSLAVWIGGACAEIDALRRAAPAVPPGGADGGFWSRVLALGGIDAVAVDVMAGASAGGLNGVIYAASQVYGFPAHALRDAWLDLGDLERMVRDGDDGGDGAAEGHPSLLRGDGYFFAQAYRTLRHLVTAPGGAAPGRPPRLDLTLTATLVEPVSRPGGPGDPGARRQDRFASTFRFRNAGPGWLTDFPPAGSPGLDAALARLALAARGTSSFPVAFEAAAVHAPRPPSFAGDPPPAEAGPAVGMAGVFGDATSGGEPFVVVDGGVLDNIPLGHAIAAVADAPAGRPTRRVLVYVRPGADGPAPPAGGASTPAPDPRGTWSVVRGIVRARIPPETIAGDLHLIEEHNRRVQRTRRLRVLAFTAVTDRRALRDGARAAEPGYLVQRADAEAQEVHGVLDDPVTALGDDPFPAADHVGDDRWRTPVAGWDEADVVRLDAVLAGHVCALLQPDRGRRADPLAFGVSPLRRVALLLLEWAQFVEQWGRRVDRAAAAAAKERLYRVLLAHREALARPRCLAWVVLAAIRPGGDDRWEERSIDAVEGLVRLGTDQAAAMEAYLGTGEPGLLDGVRRAALARLDALLAAGAGAPAPGGADLRGPLLGALVSAAGALSRALVHDQVVAERREAADPGAFLHAALAGGGRAPSADDLSALEILAFPETAVGAPGRREIEFVEMSSAAATPIGAAFPRLVGEDSRGDRAWSTVADRLRRPVPVPSDNKLAGNQLNNFAAFLRRTWRANDWMWGRLDAVAPLVAVAVTPAVVEFHARELVRVSGTSHDAAVDALVARLRAVVLGPEAEAAAGAGGERPEASWPAFVDLTAWAPRAPGVRRLAERAVTEAERPPGEPAEPIRPDELAPLVDALVSARQWAVVADELARQRRDGTPGGPPAEPPPPLTPEEAVAAADRYAVGVETLTDPRHPGDSGLVRRLVAAGRRMLQENLAGRVPGPVFAAVQSLGAVLSWSWLGTRTGFKWARAAVTALALALLVLPVVGGSAGGAGRAWSLAAVPGALAVVAGIGAGLVKRPAPAA
ncbi:MAG: patatin-like protein, partial [Acidimicrobiia bacterium]